MLGGKGGDNYEKIFITVDRLALIFSSIFAFFNER